MGGGGGGGGFCASSLRSLTNCDTGIHTSFLGLVLYILLSWSYTVAVFRDPGSPVSSNGGYSYLPAQEAQRGSSLTVKSSGGMRYCKKCEARKPDRAHHCSTCKRCVLKMDHHCPWLATCLGLRNYKAFVLFLVYTTLFCLVCFAVSMGWLYSEVLSDGQYNDNLMPVNDLVLAVVSGIFALALGGFTAWHISLAWRNQTTIEKLETTRYLSTWRNSMHQQRQRYVNGGVGPSYREQLREIHANALPGITRPEEGVEGPDDDVAEPGRMPSSPPPPPPPSSSASASAYDYAQSTAQRSLLSNYGQLERERERERYERYLDEQDSEKLPHAFDLGWRHNLRHLFGNRTLLWFVPVCNTVGDGWHWEVSPRWQLAREELTRRRAEQRARENEAGWGVASDRAHQHEGYRHHHYNHYQQQQHHDPHPGQQIYPPPPPHQNQQSHDARHHPHHHPKHHQQTNHHNQRHTTPTTHHSHVNAHNAYNNGRRDESVHEDRRKNTFLSNRYIRADNDVVGGDDDGNENDDDDDDDDQRLEEGVEGIRLQYSPGYGIGGRAGAGAGASGARFGAGDGAGDGAGAGAGTGPGGSTTSVDATATASASASAGANSGFGAN